jgi:hypothetical protein
LGGTAFRIENSSRAHAEALGAVLSDFRTELIQHNGTWQLGVDVGELEPLLVQLFETLGEWLEDSRVDSLLLHFHDRQYKLLRPAKDRQPDSSASLLERIAQLETALESRVVIEQAKGIVAVAAGVDVQDAFDLIRGAARSRRVALHAVAAAIVARPGEAESQLRRS